MKITQLASTSNLLLAWRRITTGGNYFYKTFYRELYLSYEIALTDNIRDLRTRILGGAFEPTAPERIYLPKKSGLHRPIGLLYIEDQIVLQAFANLAAKKLYLKRSPLQSKFVFSNILETQQSIFFFRRWKETYRAFQAKIETHFQSGRHWVGDFDLAAFYDTISHELLLKTIYPKTPHEGDMRWILDCLGTWSSDVASSRHGHGIPQGPIASDFLAECFLLPIDLSMKQKSGYTRYVDDFRILGKTADEVREAVILLERKCRERGLIPQSGKYEIKPAANVKQAIGSLPSLADPRRPDIARKLGISKQRALAWFKSSLEGRPLRVRDKTRLRFVMYRAQPDATLLQQVLLLVPRHPEHADVFFHYLSLFGMRKPIMSTCIDLIARSPYAYVRGEAWMLLSRIPKVLTNLTGGRRRALLSRAIQIAKMRVPENFIETLGATTFLASVDVSQSTKYHRFLQFQPALLQALVGKTIPDSAFGLGETASVFLRRSKCEPGLAICSRIHALGLGLGQLGLSAPELPTQVLNTLREIGVVNAPAATIDPIAEILYNRYSVPRTKSWHTLLKAEYVHALGILKQAEAAFHLGKSFWLAYQNSFNHTVFLALQRHLAATGHPGACTTIGAYGHLVDYGTTLDVNGPFSKHCSSIADAFRAMNARRNRLPLAHPYDKRSKVRAIHLSGRERNQLVNKLNSAYPDLVTLMP